MSQEGSKSQAKKPRIVVVGSSNVDMFCYTNQMPKSGETIKGNDFKIGFGGKGANQAIAAAKLGADVLMITKVGNDDFAKTTIENYATHNIRKEGVFVWNEGPTGVASIVVDAKGNNSIIVVAGANDQLTESEVEKFEEDIKGCEILLVQLEVPLAVTLHALKLAKKHNLTTIFNPAPARQLPTEIYAFCDYICPNEHECQLLAEPDSNHDSSSLSNEDIEAAASKLIEKGAKNVIITLGAKGSLLVNKDGTTAVKTPEVKPVDTVGAGDCFLASFGFFLGLGKDAKTAMERASVVAAESVKKHGAQASYPARSDLPFALFE